MTSSPPRMALLGALGLAVLTIAAAWGFQLIGGYVPCPLCYQQRWPYYAAIPLGLALLPMAGHPARERMLRGGLVLLGLIMLVSFGLGLHHAGVEWGWWAGPASCAGNTSFGQSGSVLPDLSRAQIASCSDAQWRFLGLSFAGYNALISLVIAGLALWGAFARKTYGSSSLSQ
ncbi:disulfide bond formation protein B [Rhodoligotrophos defluvii]|uniref:disulfide bond formation protein B n=1 Tax=Rhodoligotrophos defluvii TaxID=2561934 RepID=UPI001484EEBD|nr:disulfide bond formation protein B [Rhodoligotrophos defluvii]